MRARRGSRRSLESSGVAALASVLAVAPVFLLAIFIVWLVVRVFWTVDFWLFTIGYLALAVVLFVRGAQLLLVAPLLGARRPTADERSALLPAWRPVLQANGLGDRRYVLAVLPSSEVNAFACGGHLVVVTSYALETLPRDELSGVLAHELSHHLGLHTVALTVAQWMSVPVLLLSRIGFFLQNVAAAATTSFVRDSPSMTVLGRLLASTLTAVSWLFLSGLIASNMFANAVGRNAEFQADSRAVAMGFGRPLALALRRSVAEFGADRPRGWRSLMLTGHPPARTRVARIEAMLRHAATHHR